MCLVVKKIRHLNNKPKIAKKDIICYKMFRVTKLGLQSPFRGIIWNCGDNIKNGYMRADNFQMIPEKIDNIGNCIINNGLHSFRKLEKPTDCPYTQYINEMTKIDDYVTALCIIPKGSRYWIGRDNDYCSESLYLL